MRTLRERCLVIALCPLAAVAIGHAQDSEVTTQGKLLAKRAAEADAYRKLAEAIRGVQINSTTYVRDFVAESDEIKTALDGMIKGVRLGTPTWYEDGSCEVPAEVTVAKVVETLREIHRRHYKGNRVRAEDFTQITKTLEKSVIHAVGMGAPRIDLPPDLPEGVEEQIGPAPGPAPARAAIPKLWRQLGPQARLMALRAARVDAQRRLAERILGLRLTSDTQVRDFVAESDVITTEARGMLVGAVEVGHFLHDAEPIAEVTMRLPVESVVTTVKQLHTRHYKGNRVQGVDVERIVRNVIKNEFEATGMGTVPVSVVRRFEQVAQVDVPDWATEVVRATGEATDPNFNAAQGRLLAARGAEVVAKRNLIEQVKGLRVDSETTVRDFVAEHDAISTQVAGVLVGAYVENTEFTADTARVTVAIPAAKVWSVIYQETRVRSRPAG